MKKQQEIQAYLQALFCGTVGFIELRAIHPETGVVKRIFAFTWDEIFEFIGKHSGGYNIYVGLATRMNPKRGRKSNLCQIKTLWTDMDFRQPGDEERYRMMIEVFDLPPSMLIHSGHGLHPYWLLTQPEDIRIAERIEGYTKGLASVLGSDSCWNLDRIMRVPGTTNYPDKRKRAQAALHARKGEIAQGRFELKGNKASPSFLEFTKKYMEWSRVNKRSWRRDQLSVKHLTRFFIKRRLCDITPQLIEKYKAERKNDPRSPKGATINRELGCLKHIYNTAIKWGETESNPVSGIKYFREHKDTWRYLSEEEARKFLDACPDYFKPIAITALNTGMRKSEILNLRWFDVDFQLGQITLRDTKNGRERYVPMNRTLTKMLEKNKIKAQSEYVFCKTDGSPFKDIRKPFFKALRRAGVGEFRFHDLRHTFASQLVMKGVDLVTVKELLGHRSIDMTMRYAHLSQDHKKRAVERLDGHQMDTRANNEDKVIALTDC